MRRVVSFILFFLGGWVLAAEAMMTWLDIDDVHTQPWMMGFMAAIAAPFLLLGMWASPGNRFKDTGLTLMISAGIGAGLGLMMILISNDPGMIKAMPPGQQMPHFGISIFWGAANLVVMAGGGYLLWRLGRSSEPRQRPELERIFGDE